MNSIDYKRKYIKYKTKYLNLKGGVDKATKLRIPFSEYKKEGLFYKNNIDKMIKKVKQPLPPPIKVNDIKGKMDYTKTNKMFWTSIHLGQRKLFLCELQFLTQQMKSKDDECYVIYAGAAPSNHTYMLKYFFPNIKFILVDPRSFDLFMNEYGKSHYDNANDEIVYLKWNMKKKGSSMNIYENDNGENNKEDWCNFYQEK